MYREIRCFGACLLFRAAVRVDKNLAIALCVTPSLESPAPVRKQTFSEKHATFFKYFLLFSAPHVHFCAQARCVTTFFASAKKTTRKKAWFVCKNTLYLNTVLRPDSLPGARGGPGEPAFPCIFRAFLNIFLKNLHRSRLKCVVMTALLEKATSLSREKGGNKKTFAPLR